MLVLIYKNNLDHLLIDGNAHIVGRTMSVCVEDGTDNDYNDLYITLASWKKKG